ncbi:MAG TPA: hypothetical protein P5551_00225 [Syntrophales bacterium]|nr:hypothetical protein [Syntrophales bacterium]HRT60771.1 hypothetical protein [Syntrophales bacterium]
MKNAAKNLSLTFAAGCLGGLVSSVTLWIFAEFGILSAFNVRVGAPTTPPWWYQRIVWGGIWGFLFLIPLTKQNHFLKGLIFSLGPTLFQLFVVFPYWLNKGMMGVDLGRWTPLFIVFFNAVWGWTTALWLKWTGKA